MDTNQKLLDFRIADFEYKAFRIAKELADAGHSTRALEVINHSERVVAMVKALQHVRVYPQYPLFIERQA